MPRKSVPHRLTAFGFWALFCCAGSSAVAEDLALKGHQPSADRGYRLLTEKAFGDGLLDPQDFQRLWQVWPDELKATYEQSSAEEQQAMLLSRYGLVAMPGRSDGRPLAVAPDESGKWTTNCFQCHGGKVAGKVIPGLGNSHFAFQTLTNDLIKAVMLGVMKPPTHSPGGSKSNGHGGGGPSMFSVGGSNGTTNAQVFSIQLSLLRDNDLNLIDHPRRDKFVNHDLDAPPFWNVKKKTRLYIDGFVPKTHRVIMQFVLAPSNSGDLIKSWEDDFRDILAWIESCQPPAYPYEIDQSLAASGKAVFAENCVRCHGTYGDKEEYPELMIDIDEIGTDSVRLTGMSAAHRRFYQESWFGEYGKLEVTEEPAGYIAPPLDGIWASAPYLHNGSVPTLWHLMHSDQRPIVWLRDEDGYDQQRVGLQVAELLEVPTSIPSYSDQRLRYFDTQKKSKSAAGHTFPDELSESQKFALLEYLKTL